MFPLHKNSKVRAPMNQFNLHPCSFLRKFPRIYTATAIFLLISLIAGCSSGNSTQTDGTNATAGQTSSSETTDQAVASGKDAADTSGQAVASGKDAVDSSDVSVNSDASDTSVAPDASTPNTSASQPGQTSDASAPRSVVAVSKSIAELWLLSGGTLSGTTEDAMELDGITDETAGIGTLSRPSTEAILALSPDLVLLTEDIPAQKELKAELDGMGIKTMTIEINSFSDYLAVMSELTSLTGHPELYEKNGVQVGGRIEEIRAQAKEIADANAAARKTFLAMRVSATKNKVFKDDYFACEIFRDFGLINIAEDNSSLDDLSLEAIVAADPDYIFVIPQGKEDEAMESFKAQFEDNPVWSELSAVREGRMFIMPKDYFQYKPNAKWDLAYEYVLDLLKAA